MAFAEDRRTIVLPVIGALRSKENTRRLQRPVAQGRAKVLNMTLAERWGRLFVSVNYAVRTPATKCVSKPGVRAGVDLGLRTLATVADTEGTITEFPNPAGREGKCLSVSPARAAMRQRKPSSPAWTAAPFIYGGKPTISSPPGWRAPIARSSSKTSTSQP